jgi:hypothetical protein
MQEKVPTLRSGRVFELDFWGKTDDSEEPFVLPCKLDLESSIQEVIQENWAKFGQAQEVGEDSYIHNPVNPEMGRTRELWRVVKKYLLRRVDGRRGAPLNLYVAVGRNSLDCHWGVDGLFWWQGVYITVDTSLAPKQKRAENRNLLLKADFIISPEWLTQDGLSYVGREMARTLKERRGKLLYEERLSKKKIYRTSNSFME